MDDLDYGSAQVEVKIALWQTYELSTRPDFDIRQRRHLPSGLDFRSPAAPATSVSIPPHRLIEFVVWQIVAW
jgi:hypothetical protein